MTLACIVGERRRHQPTFAGSRSAISASAAAAAARRTRHPARDLKRGVARLELDGTRVEQYMSTIRRVTIENNQIVVTGKDGKIDRTRMSEVLRMTIEP